MIAPARRAGGRFSITARKDAQFAANSAWLVLAAIGLNLTRAAGCLASAFQAKDATATIRSPADHRPGPDSQFGTTAHPANADQLVLAARLASAIQHRDRTTKPSLKPRTGPQGHDRHRVEKPDRPATQTSRKPNPENKINN